MTGSWVKKLDETSKKFYYENSETLEVRLTIPVVILEVTTPTGVIKVTDEFDSVTMWLLFANVIFKGLQITIATESVYPVEGFTIELMKAKSAYVVYDLRTDIHKVYVVNIPKLNEYSAHYRVKLELQKRYGFVHSYCYHKHTDDPIICLISTFSLVLKNYHANVRFYYDYEYDFHKFKEHLVKTVRRWCLKKQVRLVAELNIPLLFMGDTLEERARYAKGDYSHIVSFEEVSRRKFETLDFTQPMSVYATSGNYLESCVANPRSKNKKVSLMGDSDRKNIEPFEVVLPNGSIIHTLEIAPRYLFDPPQIRCDLRHLKVASTINYD